MRFGQMLGWGIMFSCDEPQQSGKVVPVVEETGGEQDQDCVDSQGCEDESGGFPDADSGEDSDTDPDTASDPSLIDDDGDGYAEAEGDCDDTDADVYPDAEGVPADGIDQPDAAAVPDAPRTPSSVQKDADDILQQLGGTPYFQCYCCSF